RPASPVHPVSTRDPGQAPALRVRRNMFIRIKKRRGTRGGSLAFYVAKCTRENGKPRQRIVCYLASIPERLSDAPHMHGYLWRKAIAALEGAELSRRQREDIMKKLATIVPRPR